MRWLLVVLTLAGLALSHSGHCDDEQASHPASVAEAGHAESHPAGVVAELATHHHEDCPASITTVQNCRPPTSSAAVAPAAVLVRAVYGAHDARVAAGPTLSSGRTLPTLSVESLGVSRT